MRKKPHNPEDSLPTEEKAEKKRKETFSCVCGKSYGSLAAVHTHINNKHNKDEAEKKSYKNRIINPRKSANGPSTSIRMKDIKFDQKESGLMVLADTTLKDIFDYFKELQKAEEILLNEAEDDFSDDEELYSPEDNDGSEEEEGEGEISKGKGAYVAKEEEPQGKSESARRLRITAKINALRTEMGVPSLDEWLNRPEMASYTYKFKLQMVRELSKYFKDDFASKIELGLQLIVSLKNDLSEEQRETLEAAGNRLWGEHPRMREILDEYQRKWTEQMID